MSELKQKNQVLMIKDAEIDSLKKCIKELKETIDKDDSQKELQELKKQYNFVKKDKDMQNIMID